MLFNIILALILLMGLVSCTQKSASSPAGLPTLSASPTRQSTVISPTTASPETPAPATERLLTICLGREPSSLFYYDAAYTAAQDVLAAVYDGPVDIQSYVERPVIIENLPS